MNVEPADGGLSTLLVRIDVCYLSPNMPRLPRHSLKFDLFTAFLLGMLLLRGLTPVGYMPGEGPLGLKLCTSVGLADAALPSQNRNAPPLGGAGHVDAVCSFAAAPGAAPAFEFVLHIGPATSVATVPPADAQSVVQPTIYRVQSPRGPPSLA
jgi:hypothetical protein